MKQFLIKLLTSFFCFIPIISSAQVWDESVDLSKFKWSPNIRLQVTSPSLSELYIWNYNAETKDNLRNNRWQGENLTLNLNWSQAYRWKISFKISNLHDEYKYRYKVYDSKGRQKWHESNIYWGYVVTVNKSGMNTKSYTKYFSSEHYTTSMKDATWDSDNPSWRSILHPHKDSYLVTIEYDGKNNITVSTGLGNKETHTFINANTLTSISICAGPAANVHVTELSMERKTVSDEAENLVYAGRSQYHNENYLGTIESCTKAISLGYKEYMAYYFRGLSYYHEGFYKKAIDDLTIVLRMKNHSEAYLYRGLSKLALNDSSGMEDIKRAGKKGREIMEKRNIRIVQ